MTSTDNCFKFYPNFLDAINLLPEGEREKACYEFCKYGVTGELPEDKNLAMFCMGVSVSVQKYQGRGGAREGAGRKSNNQKNQKNQKNQNEQTETETKTETETETEKKKEIKKKKENEFEVFYSSYPKKEAKNKAKIAFLKAREEVSAEILNKGLERYKNHIKHDKIERKFIKLPATWLNQGCWDDEYLEESAKMELEPYNAYG